MTLFLILFFFSIAFMSFSNAVRKKGEKKMAVFTAAGAGILAMAANAASGKFPFLSIDILGFGGAEAALFALIVAQSIHEGNEKIRNDFYFLYYGAMIMSSVRIFFF